MKKLLILLLALVLAVGALPALAAEGAADITFENTVYHLTFESAEIVDGQLNVAVGGFGNSLPMRNGSFIIIAWAAAVVNGEEVEAASVSAGGNGVYTYIYDCDRLPEAVVMYPYEDEDNPVPLWQDPDTVGAPAGEPEKKPIEEPTKKPIEEPVKKSIEESVSEPEKEPVEAPVEEPREEPEEVTAEPERPQVSDADVVDVVLDALGDESFRAAYGVLLSGETVQKGSKGDTAKAVQQTLIALGQDIKADGNVGPKTIAALNAVQAALGLEETETVDAEGYEKLLVRQLIAVDPDAAEALLSGVMDAAEYDYLRGCVLYAKGSYYGAKLAFEASGTGDWEARAAACAQPWPKTGLLYKNPDVRGSNTELTVVFNSDPDVAMLVKIYTPDDVLARTLFIGGTGKATASLPAGSYVIKDGTGTDWYGEADAFGKEGHYEVMTFEDGSREVKLKKNYRSTITVNVQEYDANADSVGSRYEDWGSF